MRCPFAQTIPSTAAIADRHGLPIGMHVASARPHETQLEPTLERCFLAARPKRLVGDRAYNSDALDQRLAQQQQIELVAPPGEPLGIPPQQLPRHGPTRMRRDFTEVFLR